MSKHREQGGGATAKPGEEEGPGTSPAGQVRSLVCVLRELGDHGKLKHRLGDYISILMQQVC